MRALFNCAPPAKECQQGAQRSTKLQLSLSAHLVDLSLFARLILGSFPQKPLIDLVCLADDLVLFRRQCDDLAGRWSACEERIDRILIV